MTWNSHDYDAILREVNNANSLLREAGLRLIHLDDQECIAAIDTPPEVLNVYGMVHGGTLFTLADMAAGVCALTSSHYVVTLDATMHFLKAAKPGHLEAVAHPVHRGRTTGVYEVILYDEEHSQIGLATFTMFFLHDRNPSLPSSAA